MPESRTGFNLLSWFFSACLTVLAGAVALRVAVQLIASIWRWLALGMAVVAVLALGVTVAVAWHRRQPW